MFVDEGLVLCHGTPEFLENLGEFLLLGVNPGILFLPPGQESLKVFCGTTFLPSLPRVALLLEGYSGTVLVILDHPRVPLMHDHRRTVRLWYDTRVAVLLLNHWRTAEIVCH